MDIPVHDSSLTTRCRWPCGLRCPIHSTGVSSLFLRFFSYVLNYFCHWSNKWKNFLPLSGLEERDRNDSTKRKPTTEIEEAKRIPLEPNWGSNFPTIPLGNRRNQSSTTRPVWDPRRTRLQMKSPVIGLAYKQRCRRGPIFRDYNAAFFQFSWRV